MKYGFIGCGNMGGAIATALSKATKEIVVADRSGKAKVLAERLQIGYSNNREIAENCDIILKVDQGRVSETTIQSRE